MVLVLAVGRGERQNAGRHLLTYLAATLIIPGLLVAACGNGSDRAVAASGIAEQLVCQCSCETVLSDCLPNCVQDDTLLEIIGKRLKAGQSEEEIIQYFVGRYGSGVLVSRSHTAPTPQ